MTTASWMRARSLMRRYAIASVLLGVFAGLAGGAALGVWGIARRTSTAYARFVAYEGAADLGVFGCPPDVTLEQANDPDFSFRICEGYDYADVTQFLRGVSGVENVGRIALVIAGIAPVGDPAGFTRALVDVVVDPEAVETSGRPILVEGRTADPMAADEVTVNEEFATRAGFGVGDQFVLTPYRIDEFDAAGEGSVAPGGTPTMVTVVGVERRPTDLTGRLSGLSIYEDGSRINIGPGWWRAVDGDAARYGLGVSFTTTGSVTSDEVRAILEERWPDRPFEYDASTSTSDQSDVIDAIRLQSLAMLLVAASVAGAAVVFVGQALVRQARREWDDAPVLAALGSTRRDMVAASAARAVVIAAVACVSAVMFAIALSPLGPVGIGRAAEVSPGVSVDLVVLVVGLPVLALAVILFATLPIAVLRTGRSQSSVGRIPLLSGLPPTGVAGWAMTSSRRAGGFALVSAVGGVAVATAVGVGAWGLVASYDDLVAMPDRFGATWDASVGNVGSSEQEEATQERLRSIPDIAAVGIMSVSGLEFTSAPNFTLLAFEPLVGDVQPSAISAGRAPVTANELALGQVTMHDLGVRIGDTVTLPPDDPSAMTFEVVGEAAINDSLGARPGSGAVVTTDAFDLLAPGNQAQSYAVWIRPGADRAATLAALQDAFPTTFTPPLPSRQVLDLGLVSAQPVLLAVIVGLLACAALVHALVLSVRRGRSQIGILKTLGFTRLQVTASVAWHASVLAVASLVIGLPLGVVLGRVVWTAIVDGIGIVSPPALPGAAIVLVALVVFGVANLAALGPGRAAARTRPATALRTE